MSESDNLNGQEPKETYIYRTKNVYLASFLVSNENFFRLGKIYIPQDSNDNKAYVEIQYEPKHQKVLENFLDIFDKQTAIVNIHSYQKNIRYIMHIVNQRKGGIQ